MTQYVALLYYDRNQYWDSTPEAEFAPEYTEFARRATDHPTNVRFLTDDTAVVISEGGIIFPGQDAVASEGLVRATWVLVRRDGGWRIASYHNSPAS